MYTEKVSVLLLLCVVAWVVAFFPLFSALAAGVFLPDPTVDFLGAIVNVSGF